MNRQKKEELKRDQQQQGAAINRMEINSRSREDRKIGKANNSRVAVERTNPSSISADRHRLRVGSLSFRLLPASAGFF